MSAQKAQALVIARYDFSDTSQVAVLYTREFGKVRVIAKGSKRPKNPFQGPLDLLTLLDVVFLEKRPPALDLLTQAEMTSAFPGLRRDLARLYPAVCVAELLDALTPDGDRAAAVFDLAVATLRGLETDPDPRPTGLMFEARFLGLLGFHPRTDRCAACGQAPGDPPVFSPLRGGVVCARCRDGAAVPASRGALALLDSLGAGRVTRADRLRVPDRAAAECRELLTLYESHLLGRPPRIARFLA